MSASDAREREKTRRELKTTTKQHEILPVAATVRALHVWPQLQSHVGSDSKNKWMNYWIAVPLLYTELQTHLGHIHRDREFRFSVCSFFVLLFGLCVINGFAFWNCFFFFVRSLAGSNGRTFVVFVFSSLDCVCVGIAILLFDSLKLVFFLFNSWSSRSVATSVRKNKMDKVRLEAKLIGWMAGPVSADDRLPPLSAKQFSIHLCCFGFDEREKTNARPPIKTRFQRIYSVLSANGDGPSGSASEN